MIKKLIIIFTFLLLLLPYKTFAQSEEQILSFKEDIIVNADASVNYKETIEYYFSDPRHGITRYIPYRYKDETNDKYFSTPITNITITDENNTPYQYTKTEENGYLNLKIGDQNNTIVGKHIYIISYKISGIVSYYSDHDELYWNVTGNAWEVPIKNVSASIALPNNALNGAISGKCYTGPSGSIEENCQYNTKNGINFSSVEGPLTIVLGWNKGAVSVISRAYEKSFRYESYWYFVIPLFIFIYFLFLFFNNGRDPKGRGTIVPEFSPPNNLRPAEMGTLIDEKVGNNDISATIIDLAVKGYLKIQEKEKKFTLIKVKEFDANLNSYEKMLFKNIFSSGKESVEVKDLSSESFASAIKEIKEVLYQTITDIGFFEKNPNFIRNKYYIFAIIVIILAPALYWLSWILVGALILSGMIIIIFSNYMPRKTREGVIMKEKCLGFKEFLYRADRYKLKWQEKKGIFEKYLPYAMIFYVTDQWAKNFENIYESPPSWYQSDRATFNTIIFMHSINSFSSSASNSFSPPSSSGSSGFSGGSSGGGFGGGGGGSW